VRPKVRGTAPKWWSVPESWSAAPAADEAIELCSQPDRDGRSWEFDPWERFHLEALMGEDRLGRWAAQVFVDIVSRQQGKTDRVLIPKLVHRLIVMEPTESLYSAHLLKTARQTQAEMLRLFHNVPALASQLRKYSDGFGKEYIEMTNGAVLHFLARSRGGGRGYTVGGDIVFDEALLGLDPAILDAVLPTILTKPDSQIVFASSAGLVDSHGLRKLRDRGRAGDPEIAYIEYGMPDEVRCASDRCDHELGRVGCKWDDPAKLALVCPGIECGRVSMRSLRTLRGLLGTAGYLREIGNEWEEPQNVARFALADWQRHIEAESRSDEGAEVVFAFDVYDDQEFASITWAAPRPDGRIHVERLHSDFGSSWVVPMLEKVGARAVVADGYSPSAALKSELAARGIEVDWYTTQQMSEAAGLLQAEAKKPHVLPPGAGLEIEASDESPVSRLVHTGDPGWDDAFENLVIRPLGVGGRWMFHRTASEVGVTKLIAASMAVHRLAEREDLSGYDPLAYLA